MSGIDWERITGCLEAAMRADPSLTVEEAIRTVPVSQATIDRHAAGEDDGKRCNWCGKSGEMLSFEGRLFCGEDCANVWWYEWGHDT